MTDEMTPERLAEIKAKAAEHAVIAYVLCVPDLIAEVERLREENLRLLAEAPGPRGDYRNNPLSVRKCRISQEIPE